MNNKTALDVIDAELIRLHDLMTLLILMCIWFLKKFVNLMTI